MLVHRTTWTLLMTLRLCLITDVMNQSHAFLFNCQLKFQSFMFSYNLTCELYEALLEISMKGVSY